MKQLEDSSYVESTIPHNREAEEAVIGSILIDPECMPSLNLTSEQFYVVRNQWIYTSLENLHTNNTPIDFLTVCAELKQMGKMADIGGESYLMDLMNSTPSSYNVSAYADMVRDAAERREYIHIANKIATGAYNGGIDIASILDKLVKVQKVGDGAVGISDTLRDIQDKVEERIKDPKFVWGIPTGLEDWDRVTGGLHPQETILIVGAPASGKTTLVLQVGTDIAIKQKRHVAIYEMEMDTERLLHRAIFMHGGPSPRKLKSGYFEKEDYTTFLDAVKKLDTTCLHICDNPMLSTSMLRADLARLRTLYPIEVVIVDYMDLFVDSDGDGELERSRNRSRRFRAICREANVAGISVQALNKAGIEKTIADIQDVSGPAGVGYDADWIYTLSFDDVKKTTRLIQLKGRDAEEKMAVELVRKGLRFENVFKPRL